MIELAPAFRCTVIEVVAGVAKLVPVTGTSTALPPLTLTKNERLPFGVFVFSGFLRSIPVELEEAASIDGASRG